MTATRLLGVTSVLVTGLSLVLVAGCGGGPEPQLRAVDRTDDDGSVLVVDDDPAGPEIEAEAGVAGQAGVGEATTATVEVPQPTGGSAGTPLVVLDTDMGPDIDDALALAMLHTYADRGEIELAAVTLSRNSIDGARFIDALNTFYGRPGLPVGIDRRSPFAMADADSYVSLADRWPNDVADSGTVPDGVGVLRQALARAVEEGRRVVLIQVGFGGNVASLLDSGPDGVSPLSGPDLVVESGVGLSIMAGSLDGRRVEFNVANDVAAARRVIQGWPGDLVLSPFEVGYDIHFPYAAITQGLPGGSQHLLREAYQFRDYSWHVDAPPYYDMRTWDLTSVIQGVEPDGGWFPLSDWGTVVIDGEGRTVFDPGQGRHRVIERSSLDQADVAAVRERMIELVGTIPS